MEHMQIMADFITLLLSDVSQLIMQEPFIYFLAMIIMFIILDFIKIVRR